MTAFLGSPKVQYFKTGTVDYLALGKVYSYDAGTLTPRATYPTVDDALAETNAHTNPVVLDSRGEASIVVKGATKIILTDSEDNEIWSVDDIDSITSDILDSSGNELLRFQETASAVNEVTIVNAATGNSPVIKSTGSDTNVGLNINTKGNGILALDSGSGNTTIASGTGDIVMTGDQFSFSGTAASSITTTTGNVSLVTTSGNVNLTTASGDINLSATDTVVTGRFSIIPAGMFMWRAVNTVPTGWLECDGTAVSRTTYADLFAAISTVWGVGDGSTTFNLPNMQRRVPVGKGGSGTATLANTVGSTGGEETHTLTTPEMPAHTHTETVNSSDIGTAAGAQGTATSTEQSTNTGSTGGGGAHNNMQPSAVMLALIKT